jgi:hypothetical protein
MSKARLKFIDVLLTDILEPFQYVRRIFTGDSKDVEVPKDFTLRLHSPQIDGELTIDGELYIE